MSREPHTNVADSNPTSPAAPDCAGGSPCSDCPDKRQCERGCIRIPDFISTEFHARQIDALTAGVAPSGGTPAMDKFCEHIRRNAPTLGVAVEKLAAQGRQGVPWPFYELAAKRRGAREHMQRIGDQVDAHAIRERIRNSAPGVALPREPKENDRG